MVIVFTLPEIPTGMSHCSGRKRTSSVLTSEGQLDKLKLPEKCRAKI